jgi:hypothetical protein
MNTLAATPDRAQSGVQVGTSKKTTIEVRLASMELLVGGPYGDHRYGHTALRVNTSSVERVYDYGRYGKSFGPEGEGVLRVWTSFQAYMDDENELGRTTTGYLFEISESKANEIIASFEKKVAGKPRKMTTRFYQSYVVDKYHALGPNCTTVSIDGARIALPSIDVGWETYQKGRGLNFIERQAVNVQGWPPYIFMPADLQAMLDSPRKPVKRKTIYRKKNG